MLCWSCGGEIPDSAKSCQHCEAEVEPEPTEEEIAAVADALGKMDPEVLDELQAIFEKSETGEDFVKQIMVGDCPKCGGSNTDDCENDPEIEDICVGRCFDCGYIWCLDCGKTLGIGKTPCDRCATEDLDSLN